MKTSIFTRLILLQLYQWPVVLNVNFQNPENQIFCGYCCYQDKKGGRALII